MEYLKSSSMPTYGGIQSSAGAVPVKNSRGEISMQKVKVCRYRPNQRPEYAAKVNEESDDEVFENITKPKIVSSVEHEDDKAKVQEDPRLRRLARLQQDDSKDIIERHRVIQEPEVVEADEKPAVEEIKEEEVSSDEELSDGEVERRREAMKLRLLAKKEDEDPIKDEVVEMSEESSDEYESEYEYEDEVGPRMKPVFVFKGDRVTVKAQEEEALKLQVIEEESKKMAEIRKRETLKMVEETVRKETEAKISNEADPDDVCTDDDDGEVAFEAWKLRELKRLLRDKEEREALETEQAEVERRRNLTEAERIKEAELRPKIITNQAEKGKYRFLQKYYHRGAFYLDKNEDILKRDVSEATPDQIIEMTNLPRVKQVKHFGRCGQTKYTHLLDQDTTRADSPWAAKSAQNLKFSRAKTAGMKPIFANPSKRRRVAV